MTTATKERGEYTLFQFVNFLVWEARHKDVIRKQSGEEGQNPDLFPSTEKLLESLIRQAPNRIYFGPDGRICRVLFFSEDGLPFQARIETLNLQPQPKVIKSEGIVTGTIKALEQEITWWRRQFGMGRDLLLNPIFVMESLTTGDFIHLSGVKKPMGKISGTDFIYCRYHLSHLNGPRITDLRIRGWPAMDEGERFRLLTHPPEVILRYAHPFADPLPK